jgi:hypothetical protein
MQDKSDRRKLKRKYMVFFGRVFDRHSAQLLGNVADITSEGVMIISGRPLDVDKVYHLRMDLPEHIFSIDHLDLDGQSIWCKPDIDPAYYNTGFQLSGVTPDQTEIIDKIIKEYGIKDR